MRGKPAQDLDTALKRLDDDEAQRFWAAVAETPNSGHPGDEADAATSRPGDALGIYAWEVDGDVRRREFGRLAAVAGAAVVLDSWEVGGDHLGMTDVRRRLDRVEELEFEDQRAGDAPLVSIAVEKLACAKSKLETCAFDTATGDAFAGATGELAVLAGWLAFDADMHPLARRCYSDAMALASQADNDDLTAHTCLYAAN